MAEPNSIGGIVIVESDQIPRCEAWMCQAAREQRHEFVSGELRIATITRLVPAAKMINLQQVHEVGK